MKERTNQHSCRSFLNKKKAFTLVELLVVIAIIGILFVVLISTVDFATDKAKAKGVQTDLRSYQLALKTVGMEQQGFTNDMDLLAEQLNKNLDPKLQVTVVDDKLTTEAEDPWGTQYTITYSEPENARGKIVITSAGADRTVGTDDDYNIVIEYSITSNGGSVNIEFVEGRLDGITPPAGDGEGGPGGNEPEIEEPAPVLLAAGIYDAEDNLLADWETLTKPVAEGGYGLKASMTYNSSNYKTSAASGYSVLTNNFPTGTKLVMDTRIVGEYAFYKCDTLQHIVLANDDVSISDRAFSQCKNLKSITIPKSIQSIYYYAFNGCTSFTDVYYMSDLTSWLNGTSTIIMEYADNLYLNNVLVTNVVVPNGITTIPTYAFSSSKITNVTLPNSVTTIEQYAFKNAQITSIELPESITSIGSGAFESTALTTFNWPEQVTTIPGGCFSDCASLQSIFIPDNVQVIGESGRSSTFNNCTSLSIVDLPTSLTFLDDSAFSGCSGLQGIYIDSVEHWLQLDFGTGAANQPPLYYAKLYANNELVTSVTVPDSVTTINNQVFSGYKHLESITFHNNIQSIGESAFKNCSALAEGIEIPDSVTSIGSGAFYGCKKLQYIKIGSGCQTIGSWAFNYCSALKKVYIKDVAAWCGITFNDTPLYNEKMEFYLNDVLVTNLVIPASVTKINANCFKNCASIESITFVGDVTEIGDYAFFECSNLTSIVLPNTVQKIGISSFRNTSKLTSITIPSSVTSIGNNAFYWSGITSITLLSDTPPTIGVAPFATGSSAELTAIYVPAESVDAYKAAAGWSTYADKIQAAP